jgi:hypothetical protein
LPPTFIDIAESPYQSFDVFGRLEWFAGFAAANPRDLSSPVEPC